MKSPNKLALTLLCGVLAVNSVTAADHDIATMGLEVAKQVAEEVVPVVTEAASTVAPTWSQWALDGMSSVFQAGKAYVQPAAESAVEWAKQNPKTVIAGATGTAVVGAGAYYGLPKAYNGARRFMQSRSQAQSEQTPSVAQSTEEAGPSMFARAGSAVRAVPGQVIGVISDNKGKAALTAGALATGAAGAYYVYRNGLPSVPSIPSMDAIKNSSVVTGLQGVVATETAKTVATVAGGAAGSAVVAGGAYKGYQRMTKPAVETEQVSQPAEQSAEEAAPSMFARAGSAVRAVPGQVATFVSDNKRKIAFGTAGALAVGAAGAYVYRNGIPTVVADNAIKANDILAAGSRYVADSLSESAVTNAAYTAAVGAGLAAVAAPSLGTTDAGAVPAVINAGFLVPQATLAVTSDSECADMMAFAAKQQADAREAQARQAEEAEALRRAHQAWELDEVKADANYICNLARNLVAEILAKTEGYDDEIDIYNDDYIVVLEELANGNDLTALRNAVARARGDFLDRLYEILRLENIFIADGYCINVN